jgi:hypothetical protein
MRIYFFIIHLVQLGGDLVLICCERKILLAGWFQVASARWLVLICYVRENIVGWWLL